MLSCVAMCARCVKLQKHCLFQKLYLRFLAFSKRQKSCAYRRARCRSSSIIDVIVTAGQTRRAGDVKRSRRKFTFVVIAAPGFDRLSSRRTEDATNERQRRRHIRSQRRPALDCHRPPLLRGLIDGGIGRVLYAAFSRAFPLTELLSMNLSFPRGNKSPVLLRYEHSRTPEKDIRCSIYFKN